MDGFLFAFEVQVFITNLQRVDLAAIEVYDDRFLRNERFAVVAPIQVSVGLQAVPLATLGAMAMLEPSIRGREEANEFLE